MPNIHYNQYIDLLSEQNEMRSDVVANMIAAGWMMQYVKDDDPLNREEISITAGKLMDQPAFRQLMADPRTAELAKNGNVVELSTLLNEKANAISEVNDYVRKPETAEQDSNFLKAAIKDLKDQAKKAPAMKQKQLARFNEMVRQMEAAQQKCEAGVGLTGEEAKAMVTAVQKYNDKGTRMPGGVNKAVGYVPVMCTLQRFMPRQQFSRYCEAITRQHGDQHEVKPTDFDIPRMNGYTKSGNEWRQELKKKMARDPKIEDIAAVAALAKLQGTSRETPVTRQQLDAEVKVMMTPGSGFLRTMKDPAMVREFNQLAQEGNLLKLGKKAYDASRRHVAAAAGFQYNRSVRELTQGNPNKFMTQAHLANILAAGEMLGKPDAGNRINMGAFRERAATIAQDPAFQNVVARYNNDPQFRNEINRNLGDPESPQGLRAAYERQLEAAGRQRHRQPEQPQPQPGQPVPQR